MPFYCVWSKAVHVAYLAVFCRVFSFTDIHSAVWYKKTIKIFKIQLTLQFFRLYYSCCDFLFGFRDIGARGDSRMNFSWSIAGEWQSDSPVWSIRVASDMSGVTVDELRRSAFSFHLPPSWPEAFSGWSYSLRLSPPGGFFFSIAGLCNSPLPRLTRETSVHFHRVSPPLRRCRPAGVFASTRLRL